MNRPPWRAAALGLLVATGAAHAQGTPRPAGPAAATDPVRASFQAALAPGLGDSTRVRLNRFLATYARHPLAKDAQYELGLLSYAEGDYAGARAHFRRARPAQGGEEARYWEGLSAFALGDPRDARDAVLAVARSRRDVARRWDSAYLVALSWAEEGRRPEALAAYRSLLALPAGPGQAAALYQAERLATELTRDEDAAEWRNRLLRNYPRSPEAASVRAETQALAPARPAAGKPATPAPVRH